MPRLPPPEQIALNRVQSPSLAAISPWDYEDYLTAVPIWAIHSGNLSPLVEDRVE